jgi:penicillin-binding protein 2
VFVGLLAIVFARMVHLEWTQGAAFREEAGRPRTRSIERDAVRGRILARNGAVMAADKKQLALAVHYRWLETEPDPQWLRSQARSRLPKAKRRDPQCVADAMRQAQAERMESVQRLRTLCGLSQQEWNRRSMKIEARVQHIAERVNQRRRDEYLKKVQAESERNAREASQSWWETAVAAVRQSLRISADDSPPDWIPIREESEYHVMTEGLSLETAAEIEADAGRYPGARIVERWRRTYPGGTLAAHIVGHLGPVDEEELAADASGQLREEDRIGRMGVERRFEPWLRGRRGQAIEVVDQRGRVVRTDEDAPPQWGRDVVLTIDPPLQTAAETLLDNAMERRRTLLPDASPAGGAILVMDVRNGAILAAASAPRFDPNVFAGSADDARRAAILADPAHPLFDRAIRMAIPPGSVFKTITAIALLESATVDPNQPFACQGYLRQPDQMRCAIYRQRKVGHGEIAMVDAIAQSCNVYFFHHAARMGPKPLVDWAARLGFGRTTGIDLPGEAAGTLPSPDAPPLEASPAEASATRQRPWKTVDTQVLSVGQGHLEATPAQIVRMMAAVANGGQLVTPHAVRSVVAPSEARRAADSSKGEDDAGGDSADPVDIAPPRAIEGLKPSTLAAVRQGLKRVVCDPQGTGHGAIYLDSIEIAGKTGTAQTDEQDNDHAWFAGYVPADRPRVAFVVVLEHAGNAGETAGPVAQRLVLKMQQLGVCR